MKSTNPLAPNPRDILKHEIMVRVSRLTQHEKRELRSILDNELASDTPSATYTRGTTSEMTERQQRDERVRRAREYMARSYR